MTDSNQQSTGKSLAEGSAGLLASQTMMVIFTVIILFAGWSIFMYYGVAFGIRKSFAKQAPVEAKALKATALKSSTANSSITSYRESENALLLSIQSSELRFRCDLLDAKLKEAFQLRKTWDQRLQDLSTSEEGYRLATEPLSRKYLHLKQNAPLILHELEQVSELISKIRETLKTSTLPISNFEEIDGRLAQAENLIASGIPQIGFYNEHLSEMLRSATQKQSQSLKQMISQLNDLAAKSIASRVDDMLKKSVAAQQAAENAALRKQEDLKSSQASSIAKLEIVRADAKRSTAKSSADSAAISNKLSAARRDARRSLEQELPSLRSMLLPFISDGQRQPETASSMLATIDTGPVSYSALIRFGAIEDNKAGLYSLFQYGRANDGYRFGSNDRPVGTFPQYKNEQDIENALILEQLRKIQSFLRRHGEAMVEAKLLAP